MAPKNFTTIVFLVLCGGGLLSWCSRKNAQKLLQNLPTSEPSFKANPPPPSTTLTSVPLTPSPSTSTPLPPPPIPDLTQKLRDPIPQSPLAPAAQKGQGVPHLPAHSLAPQGLTSQELLEMGKHPLVPPMEINPNPQMLESLGKKPAPISIELKEDPSLGAELEKQGQSPVSPR